MGADGFTSISRGEECRGSYIRGDLVRDEDGDVAFLDHALYMSEMLPSLD